MSFLLKSFRDPSRKHWRIAAHFSAWTVFIAYELTTVFFFDGSVKTSMDTLLYYLLYITLFYVHADVVLPFVFSRPGPQLALVALVVVEIAVALLVKYCFDWIESYRLDYHNPAQLRRYLFLSIWRDVYFLGFSTVYWMVRRLFRYRRRMAEAERSQLMALKEKAEAERNLTELRYAFLQQQASPHFLFNTLNFVYNSVYQVSPAASKMLLRLADLMRYSLHEDDKPASLEKELEQIRNLIEMNRLRYDGQLYLEYREAGEFTGLSVIPLVLLTFTENVFKHGNLRDPLHPARIEIVVGEEKWLEMRTWNLKKRQPVKRRLKSLGVENARRRLDYAYGERYDLNARETDETFELKLMIRL